MQAIIRGQYPLIDSRQLDAPLAVIISTKATKVGSSIFHPYIEDVGFEDHKIEALSTRYETPFE